MPILTQSYGFNIEDNPVCWKGSPTYFELKLQTSFVDPSLEALRRRFLYVLTSNHDQVQSARALVQMAFETEIGVVLTKIISVLDEVKKSVVCPRLTYLQIDQAMAPFSYMFEPALQTLIDNKIIPAPYVRLFRQHFLSKYPRYRVCAIAALLCMATYYLTPDKFGSVVQFYPDVASVVDTRVVTPGHVIMKADVISVLDAYLIRAVKANRENVYVVDAFHKEYGRVVAEQLVAADQTKTVLTEVALWRVQNAPPPKIAYGSPYSFYPPAAIYGTSDTDIYIGGYSFIWHWDGASWSNTSWPEDGSNVTSIWCPPGQSGIAWACASNNLYKTTNSGASWLPQPFPNGYNANYIWGSDANNLWVVTNQVRIFRTRDGGASWSLEGDFSNLYYPSIVSIWGTNSTNVYMGGSGPGGALLLHYDGTAWTRITTVLTLLDTIYSIWGTDYNDIYLGGYIFAGSKTLLHTGDGGATFQIQSIGISTTYGIGGQRVQGGLTDHPKQYAVGSKANGSNSNIFHYLPPLDAVGLWSDDSPVNNTYQMVGFWMNDVTGRGVAAQQYSGLYVPMTIQTNKRVAGGFALNGVGGGDFGNTPSGSGTPTSLLVRWVTGSKMGNTGGYSNALGISLFGGSASFRVFATYATGEIREVTNLASFQIDTTQAPDQYNVSLSGNTIQHLQNPNGYRAGYNGLGQYVNTSPAPRYFGPYSAFPLTVTFGGLVRQANFLPYAPLDDINAYPSAFSTAPSNQYIVLPVIPSTAGATAQVQAFMIVGDFHQDAVPPGGWPHVGTIVEVTAYATWVIDRNDLFILDDIGYNSGGTLHRLVVTGNNDPFTISCAVPGVMSAGITYGGIGVTPFAPTIVHGTTVSLVGDARYSSGTTGPAITYVWSVFEGGNSGVVNPNGNTALYTAPTAPGTYHVKVWCPQLGPISSGLTVNAATALATIVVT